MMKTQEIDEQWAGVQNSVNDRIQAVYLSFRSQYGDLSSLLRNKSPKSFTLRSI
jgi:hypothetical protein